MKAIKQVVAAVSVMLAIGAGSVGFAEAGQGTCKYGEQWNSTTNQCEKDS